MNGLWNINILGSDILNVIKNTGRSTLASVDINDQHMKAEDGVHNHADRTGVILNKISLCTRKFCDYQ
jgi:hypothetical protein